MHHKVMLLDIPEARKELVTGSYNFTNNASKQSYENCVRFRHTYDPAGVAPALPPVPQIEDVIDNYQAEFNRLWERADEIDPDFMFAPPTAAPIDPLPSHDPALPPDYLGGGVAEDVH
jgi:phosphatidylserine/phosphatidylglycerophosphate/cardiolipin synthase-like enzyme